MTEEGLIEYAKDEANEVAICLWKFRQKNDSCSRCSTQGFCDLLMKKLEEFEVDTDE